MTELDRNSLLSAWTPTIERIDVDGNGGHVFVRGWTVGEQLDWEKREDRDAVDVVILSACNSKGDPLFTPDDRDEIAQKLSPELLNRITRTVLRLNGEGEDLEGN